MKRKKSIFALAITVLVASTSCGVNSREVEMGNTIPYPEEYDIEKDGASSYYGYGEHRTSPYFVHPGFYNMKSNDTLTIIPEFETYQQTASYTCGACSSLMVLNNFENTDYKEMEISEIEGIDEELGVGPEGIVKFFEEIGWDVESSLDKDGELTFEEMEDFQEWVKNNLSQGIPIIVGWIDWGGHWQVIIGYDTMGTEDHLGDDVIILADPYDTSDHLQDGYCVVSAEKFFSMWEPGFFSEEYQPQPWITAKPKLKKH